MKELVYSVNRIGGGLQAKMPWVQGFWLVVSPSTTLQLSSKTSPAKAKIINKETAKGGIKNIVLTSIDSTSQGTNVPDAKVESRTNGCDFTRCESDSNDGKKVGDLHTGYW